MTDESSTFPITVGWPRQLDTVGPTSEGANVDIVSMQMTVADYCDAMEKRDIVVNPEYQRSDKVWPETAKSFLIETILLGFPIPKLSLHQKVDLKSRKTVKDIVDGQQRSRAVLDFYQGSLRLTRSLDTLSAVGRTYEELDEELQTAFLNYGLALDVFIDTTEDDVREVFRRMNSFTVPLNPEEQRHAVYQGRFKWFIQRLAKTYDQALVDMGVFGQKQIVRMADAKLLTEICHGYINGIKTTSRTSLDALYKAKDKDFPEEEELEARLIEAFDQLLAWPDLHRTALMKPFVVYSLVLALVHNRHDVPALRSDTQSAHVVAFDDAAALPALSALAEALEASDQNGSAGGFVTASSEKTTSPRNDQHDSDGCVQPQSASYLRRNAPRC